MTMGIATVSPIDRLGPALNRARRGRSNSLPAPERDEKHLALFPGGFRRDFIMSRKDSDSPESDASTALPEGTTTKRCLSTDNTLRTKNIDQQVRKGSNGSDSSTEGPDQNNTQFADLLQNTLVDFLASGGDDRLILNERGVNKYNTPALPHPDGIHRSSCTSNCCTDYSFMVGRKLVSQLMEDASNRTSDGGEKYEQLITNIRKRMFKVWGLDKQNVGITLCPSGSDAEYMPLLIALLRMLEMDPSKWGNGILTIVTGAGEVGTGTALASAGKHFSNVSPKIGMKLKSGTPVFNLPENFPGVDCIEVTMRDRGSYLKSQDELDKEVTHICEMALEEQNYQVVCVHMVTGSKTGYLVPSVSVLQELSKRYGKKVVPIVDACQGRLMEGALKQLLDNGFAILVTGSKFYGGPPFSGAILLPKSLSDEVNNSPKLDMHMLGDLHAFIDAQIVSHDMPILKQRLFEACKMKKIFNYGVLVRWALALNEIEMYHEIPEVVRDNILKCWVDSVRALVKEFDTPCVTAIDNERPQGVDSPGFETPEQSSGMFWCNTIVSLTIKVPAEQDKNDPTKVTKYRRLGLDELRKLHMLMTRDLKGHVKVSAVADSSSSGTVELPGPHGTTILKGQDGVLSQKCFIAQPVQLQTSMKFGITVIRIAIGAPLVTWIFKRMQRISMNDPEVMQKVIADVNKSDRVLLRKMITILDNWDALKDFK